MHRIMIVSAEKIANIPIVSRDFLSKIRTNFLTLGAKKKGPKVIN